MKSITPRNIKITAEEFLELERRLGGPVKAARSAGVAYPTWYRWRNGKLRVTQSLAKLLLLLLQTTRMPFQAGKGENRGR